MNDKLFVGHFQNLIFCLKCEKVDTINKNKLSFDRIIEIHREVIDFIADNSKMVNKVVFSELVIND